MDLRRKGAVCAPVLPFGMESSRTFCPPNLPAESPKTHSLGQQPSSVHHRGVNKSLKVKVPSSSCKRSIYRPQVRGCAADNQIPSRPSNSSDKSPRRKAGNADTAYGASLLPELSEWEFVRHSDSRSAALETPPPNSASPSLCDFGCATWPLCSQRCHPWNGNDNISPFYKGFNEQIFVN